MTPEETAAALAKAEQERDALKKAEQDAVKKAEQLEAKVAELEKAAEKPEEKPAPVDKSDLSPAVREMLEKAEKAEEIAKAERDQLRKQAERAEEIAKAERETRLQREFVTKAEGFRALALDPAKAGPVLKAVAEHLSKEDAETLDQILKAADARIAENDVILKQLGRDGDPAAGNDDVAARKAEEIRKADPSVSQFEAMRRAMRDPQVQAALAR